jgi:hypothetical protein
MRFLLLSVLILISHLSFATPSCDAKFKTLINSKDYGLIKKYLGAGYLSKSGPLYVWREGRSTLIAGYIGNDLGMMIEPANITPPQKFTKAMNDRGIKDVKRLMANLGKPNLTRKIGYYRWSCIDKHGHIQYYYLTIDSSGTIYFDDFSYPKATVKN